MKKSSIKWIFGVLGLFAAVFAAVVTALNTGTEHQPKIDGAKQSERQAPQNLSQLVSPTSSASGEESTSELEASLTRAMKQGDQAALDEAFRKIELALQRAELSASFAKDLGRMVRSARVGKPLKLGLVQAMIEGAGNGALRELIDCFHQSMEPDVTDLIRQRLGDLQGGARLEGRGMDLSQQVIQALENEPGKSDLMYPLAVALTKNPSAASVRYLLDKVSATATTLEELNRVSDPKVDALVVALTENRLHSNEAVPMLIEELNKEGTTEVRRWLANNALVSIGSPEAIAPFLESLRQQSVGNPDSIKALVARLVHPEAKELMVQALSLGFASDAVRQVVAATVAGLP